MAFCNAAMKRDMLLRFQYMCRDQEDMQVDGQQGLRDELLGRSGGFYPYLSRLDYEHGTQLSNREQGFVHKWPLPSRRFIAWAVRILERAWVNAGSGQLNSPLF